MKRMLTSKAGVTILEGVIALGLLALVAGGAFGVLLSASRQTTQPDIREEMTWAVEKAHDKLKAYLMYTNTGLQNLAASHLPVGAAGVGLKGSDGRVGLCGNETNPLSTGIHTINCMLPPICDQNGSTFTYRVTPNGSVSMSESVADLSSVLLYNITFSITCNGYKL